MGGYQQSSAAQTDAGHVTGVPRSGLGLSVRDGYEYGSVSGVSATGRYKVFATPFSAVPSVILTPLRTAGSMQPILFGTPSVGSFRARMDRVGSTMLHFIAFGAR